MTITVRIGKFLARRRTGVHGQPHGARPNRPAPPTRGQALTGPREVINDAERYGVAITPAAVLPGATYWQAVRVHHLTPEENGGNHHIYIDILDPLPGGGNPDGSRLYGARARVTWDGGDQVVTVEKPSNEPGTNFPMWKWQVCAATALGLPGLELPSDCVTGLHTAHPDEAPGNTLFHHSFSITFVKAQIPLNAERDSVIYGVIRNGAGRTARLLTGDQVAAEVRIGADDTFRFVELAAGEYVVELADTGLRSEPVRLDGRNQVQLELELILAASIIRGRVRNGVGRTVVLMRGGTVAATQVIASDETYYFSALTAGEYRVSVEGAAVLSELLIVDGANTLDADLVIAVAGKALGHYVLLGPAGRPVTEANALLAQEYILAFQPSCGFSPEEAAAAGMVTIIAAEDAVSAEVEAQLAADGTPVQRFAGPVEEVAAALAARVAAGKAFA